MIFYVIKTNIDMVRSVFGKENVTIYFCRKQVETGVCYHVESEIIERLEKLYMPITGLRKRLLLQKYKEIVFKHCGFIDEFDAKLLLDKIMPEIKKLSSKTFDVQKIEIVEMKK